jgi:phospholipase/carboxylesterase
MSQLLDTLDIETAPKPQSAIIFMHGLGADAHDFEPVVPEFAQVIGSATRFVFPNAPVRPITINNGYPMRAWFDIGGFNAIVQPDEKGIRASAQQIQALIKRENERGIATNRIVLAGFSQGGAMSVFTGVRHPERLAGIMSLSGFAPLADTIDAERTSANQDTPIFLAHGTQDPIVSIQLGYETRRMLESRGYSVEWHEYPMPHTVSMEELQAIAHWLRRVCSASPQ